MGRYSISTTFTLSVKLTELLNLYVKLIRYLTRCLKQHVNVRYTLFLRYVKENNNCKIKKNLDYYICVTVFDSLRFLLVVSSL